MNKGTNDNTFREHESKTVSIEFWRLVFCFAVVVYHSCYLTPSRSFTTIFQGGYIGVEFFFIVSGFLMAKSIFADTGHIRVSLLKQTLTFISRKIKRIYPCFLWAFLIAFIVRAVISGSNLAQILHNIIDSIPELLLLRMSGITGYWVNTPTWYISAMAIVMLIFYPILQTIDKKLFLPFSIITSASAYSWLYYSLGTLENPYKWQQFCYSGLIRGVGGIMLGAACFKLSSIIRGVQTTGNWRFMAYLLSIIELSCYLTVIFVSFSFGRTSVDFLLVALLAIAVTLSFSEKTLQTFIFKKHAEFCLYCGRFSIALYLNHRMFTLIFPIIGNGINYWILLPAYLLCASSAAFIAMSVVPKFRLEKI